MTTNVTCSSGGTTFTSGQPYTDANNVTYTVDCATNNFHGAYTHLQVENAGFGACFAACDSSADCVGWTFSGNDYGFCYLKDGQGLSFPADDSIVSGFKFQQPGSLTTSSSVATPTPSSPFGASLAANGTTFTEVATGDVYEIWCGYDYTGYDISSFPSPGYEGCFSDCSRTVNCTAIAYLGGPDGGFCYTKYNLAGGEKSLADSAKLASKSGKPFPLPTTSSSSSTSSAPGPTFTGYMVELQSDHPNGDLKAERANNFTDCQVMCDDTVGCIGYAYAGSFDGSYGPGLCYWKSDLTPGVDNELVRFAFKAVATPPPPTYSVEYDTDHFGGDIMPASGESFVGCEKICNKLVGCIAYAYVGPLTGPGTCYLKSSIGAAETNNNVNFAYKQRATQPTAAVSTSTASSSTAAPTSTFPAGSCEAASAENATYTGSNAAVYILNCNSDRRDGDLSSQSASSFIDCMAICDSTNGCLGYAYVGGTGSGICYMKDSIQPGESSTIVDFAFRSRNSTAGETEAASTTSKSPSTPVPSKSSTFDGSCRGLASADNGTYTDAAGQTYRVTCGADIQGDVVGIENGASFESCMRFCDTTVGCEAYAYVSGFPGTCYLKGEVGEYLPNRSGVSVAVKVSAVASTTADRRA